MSTKTRVDKNGNQLATVTIWLDTADLGELIKEAGRRSTAEGRVVKLPDVIRDALRRVADEVRGGQPEVKASIELPVDFGPGPTVDPEFIRSVVCRVVDEALANHIIRQRTNQP